MASFWAALEAFPALIKLIQELRESFDLYQLSKIDDPYTEKESQRKALLSVLKKGVSDEERKHLVRLLYQLNHNP